MDQRIEMVSNNVYNILIIEDDDHYLREVIKYIEKYFVSKQQITVVNFAKKINNIALDKFNVIICDIALRKDTHEDLDYFLGFDIINILCNKCPDAIIIAWTVFTKEKVKPYIDLTKVHYCHKPEGARSLLDKMLSLLLSKK